MPTLIIAERGASEAQKAIRASRAMRARRDFGLAACEGNVAAFWQWTAWQRGEGRGAGPSRDRADERR